MSVVACFVFVFFSLSLSFLMCSVFPIDQSVIIFLENNTTNNGFVFVACVYYFVFMILLNDVGDYSPCYRFMLNTLADVQEMHLRFTNM